MSRDKVVWYAPRWSTVPKQWWALRKYVFSVGPLKRIGLVSSVAVAVTLIGFKLAFPAAAIPNLWPLLIVIAGLAAMLTLQTFFLSLTKARISITAKKITISYGQNTTVIKPEWLTAVTLAIHDEGRTRMRLCYDKGGRSKHTTIGVSEDCELSRIEQLLPVEIVAKDFRTNHHHD